MAQHGAANPRMWVEIGAGHGEMTRLLAATSADVLAIEVDPQLHPRLREVASEFANVRVIAGDALAVDLAELAAGRRFSVYGNLPYYITSPILHRLFACADQLEAVHLVMQLEVAARVVAQPGSRAYGYLSVAAQYWSRPELVFRIPRGAFRPPPKVTSALVTLRLPGERARLGMSGEERFFDFVKLSFSQKRKTLVNNLRRLAAPEIVREALGSLSLSPGARAEQLTVAALAELYRRLVPA